MRYCAHASLRVAALVASTALAACHAPDTLTPPAAASSDVTIAARPVPSPFTVADLGVPTGYTTSYGEDVNDQGIVVGFATSTAAMAGWMYVNGNFRLLPPLGLSSAAYAVSSANPYFIAGFFSPAGSSNLPALWEVFGVSPGFPSQLPSAGAGAAYGVNDGGDAAGTLVVAQGTSSTRRAAIWQQFSPAEIVAPPLDYTITEATDINSFDYSLVNASGSPSRAARAYVHTYLAQMIPLPPPADLAAYGTYAEAISEVNGVVIYIAGKVQLTPEQCYAARWTLDLSTGQTTVEVRREAVGSAWGVSNDGTYVGVQSIPGGSHAYAWTLANAALELPLPRGVRYATASAIDGNGVYITGWADVPGAGRHAMLWTAVGP